jgi:hypothetical protein
MWQKGMETKMKNTKLYKRWSPFQQITWWAPSSQEPQDPHPVKHSIDLKFLIISTPRDDHDWG